METIDEKCAAEIERINTLLEEAEVKEKKIKLLQPVIENTAWMKAKLDDARLAIKNSQIVIAYDNGGNQKGIRENPMYKGYEALWKAYMTGMQKIIDCIPDAHIEIKQEEIEKPKTMLEIVKARKNAV